jgi:hypothetical protein
MGASRGTGKIKFTETAQTVAHWDITLIEGTMQIDQQHANRTKLILATSLVREVTTILNTQTILCNSCGVIHYTNRVEFQAHRELEAVAHKIDRFINSKIFFS